jgi:hypothetical protein
MEHIAGHLEKIEQNMKLNTADPIARYGFTQLPNFILRNPDLSANAKTVYSLLLSYAWHNKAYRERGAMKQDDPQSAALEILGITDGRYYLTLLFALLVEVGSALGLFIALADAKPKELAQWKPRAA